MQKKFLAMLLTGNISGAFAQLTPGGAGVIGGAGTGALGTVADLGLARLLLER